jgi:integrase/recombinase XerD
MKIGSINYQLFIYTSKTNTKGYAPVYCKLFYGNKLKLLSTGVSIQPCNWDIIKYQVYPKDEINRNILEIWKLKLHKLLLDCYFNNTPVDLNHIALQLTNKTSALFPKLEYGFIEIYKVFITNTSNQPQVQRRTIQKYNTVLNTLVTFLINTYGKKDIPLHDLKLKHLLEYEEYCLAVLKHKQITVNKSIQGLKQIIKYAIGHDYLNKDPWLMFKPKGVHTEILYLKKEQLSAILNANGLCERLEKVKDCFIFSCYSGLAYSEISSINTNNIIIKNDVSWISMKRKKTHKNFLIPMLPPAKKIWDKYEGVLPVLSNQKYNAYLKELAVVLSLDVHLTTHLARKTFTTTVLLENNIPLKVASALLGHSNTKITEKHYAEVTNDLLEQHVHNLIELFKAL